MAAKRTKHPENSGSGNGANFGFEAPLWRAAAALRGSMDAAEHEHVLGLVYEYFLSQFASAVGKKPGERLRDVLIHQHEEPRYDR